LLPYTLQIADIDVIKYDIIDLVILYLDQYFILDNLNGLGNWVKVPYFLTVVTGPGRISIFLLLGLA